MLNVRRISPGNYIVNNRYYVTRMTSVGSGPDRQYDSGPSWRWIDGNSIGVGGDWRATKADAMADLADYLKG